MSLQWRKILCNCEGEVLLATQEGYNTQTPFPTAVSEMVLRSGVFELSVEIVRLKGCIHIGIVRLSMDAEDLGKGLEPLRTVGGLSDWRTTPSGGWFEREKNGLASIIRNSPSERRSY